MLRTLRGINVPPWIVASARGLLEAALMAGLVAASVYITSDSRLVVIAPVGLFIIRWLEGWVDQIDPSKTNAPPAIQFSGVIENYD